VGLPVQVAELANPVNRQAQVALDVDQALQPHEIVWADTEIPTR
jgi:hypothetical protein